MSYLDGKEAKLLIDYFDLPKDSIVTISGNPFFIKNGDSNFVYVVDEHGSIFRVLVTMLTVIERSKPEQENNELIAWQSLFNKRIADALNHAGIKTFAELQGKSDSDLRCLRNLGRSSIEEIKRVIKETPY